MREVDSTRGRRGDHFPLARRLTGHVLPLLDRADVINSVWRSIAGAFSALDSVLITFQYDYAS